MLSFHSKTEAYFYAIYILNKFAVKYPKQAKPFLNGTSDVRTCIENHVQNPAVVANMLRTTASSSAITIDEKNTLLVLADLIQTNRYEQSALEKWKNPLGRRFESQLQITLLLHPTDLMMSAVKKISEKILGILDSDKSLQETMASHLSFADSDIAFGSFSKRPPYSELKNFILKNNPKHLPQILHMHFKFSKNIVRELDQFETVSQKTAEYADTRMYEDDYYRDRGRLKITGPHRRTEKMGLGTFDTEPCHIDLPTLSPAWVSDAKVQKPDLKSAYVISSLDNDTPYVSGPSGMAALLVGQMFALDVLPTLAERQAYIATISAYLVSGGLHSLHEVLGPIAYCLPEHNLVPEYNASSPEEIAARRSRPPNFHVFYRHMSTIDPQFAECIESAWFALNTFFEKCYMRLTENAHLREPWQLADVAQSSAPIESKKSSFDPLFKDKMLRCIESIVQFDSAKKKFLLGASISANQQQSLNYKKILQDAETEFQAYVIIYALLDSDNDSELKKGVSNAINSKGIDAAKNSVAESIHQFIKDNIVKLYPGATQEIINIREREFSRLQRDLILDVTLPLSSYLGQADKGIFAEALQKLSKIEIELKQNESTPRNRL